ncbi:hypothetical protein DPMN_176492 [Dreissena polymorpha]|uniref:Uncharacterized protein n=1 Tax=Dreissena polymorpha TaxID=45954 RepID=A0A9D4EB36_DREPO|nr:hypothetical protein DPMN_176492 [Dreissena polymorpha]
MEIEQLQLCARWLELQRDRAMAEIGIRDTQVRKRLLQEEKLTLQKCIDMCRGAEASSAKIKTISNGASGVSDDVYVVKPKSKPQQKPRNHRGTKSAVKKCHYLEQIACQTSARPLE